MDNLPDDYWQHVNNPNHPDFEEEMDEEEKELSLTATIERYEADNRYIDYR